MTFARVQARPRPVFCVVGHAYRNVALAEEICAGRFTHVGLTLELGLPPDWHSTSLPADEEWRIEWSKFYYGLDLAHAYAQTGDNRFLRAWESLLESWIRQVPPGSDSSDVAARRIQNWIYAWDIFASAPDFPGLADGLDETILASLAAQIEYVRTHLTPERNHRTLELYSLFISALALPELDPRGEMLDSSFLELRNNLLADVLPDGVHRECSTHYHMIALRSFLGARENARRFALPVPDGYDERLERACEFAMHLRRPDGNIPALSDSDTGNYSDVLDLAASLFSRSDFLYAATNGAEGTPPRSSCVSFPHGGYHVQRSGWGENGTPCADERFLIFDCGPLGDGGHGHYDLLNVEIAAGGRPLVMDPGRYTYSEQAPNLRRWFKGTAAHNTVCVDGLDQIPYRRGRPKGPQSQGRLVEQWSAPGFHLLCGEACSPLYDAVHTRRVVFVANEYWLLADQLRGDRPHHYDLRFHLAPEAWERTTVRAANGNWVVRAPGLALVFAAPSQPKIEQGWVSPEYGIKLPAPVVSVTVASRPDADFFTLVVPFDTEERAAPGLEIVRRPSLASPATVVRVRGAGADGSAVDHVAWSGSGQTVALGPVAVRAAAAWLRAHAASFDFRACEVEALGFAATGTERVATGGKPARCVVWQEASGVMPPLEDVT